MNLSCAQLNSSRRGAVGEVSIRVDTAHAWFWFVLSGDEKHERDFGGGIGSRKEGETVTYPL